MKTKSGMTIAIAVSVSMLAGCQHTLVTPSKINSTPQNIDNDIKLIVPLPDIPDSDGDGVLDHVDYCPKTPVGVIVDDKGCPEPVDLADTVTIDLRVFFEHGDYELQDKFLPQVEMVAKKMYSDPKLIVFLSGYTSSKHEDIQIPTMTNKETDEIKTYNQLGQKRAQRIKKALLEQGIPAEKIYTFDCADNIPVAPNDTEEGATMNQRVYGRALPADDFFTGTGYGQSDSFDYYQSLCQQF